MVSFFLSSINGLLREAILIYNKFLVVWSKMITRSGVVDIWEPLWPSAAVLLFSLTLNTESLPLLFHCHCPCFFGHNLFSTCWSSPTSFSKSVNSVFSHNSPASFFFGWFPIPLHLPCSSIMSSLLQCSTTHLSGHHSHHAVAVPRWAKG